MTIFRFSFFEIGSTKAKQMLGFLFCGCSRLTVVQQPFCKLIFGVPTERLLHYPKRKPMPSSRRKKATCSPASQTLATAWSGRLLA
jgi:hypothetical protein